MFCRRGEILHPYHTLQHRIGIRVLRRDRYDSRTVNQVYPPHQGDVLPNLGFAGDRSDGADFFLLESVDDAGFPDVGVPDEAHRNLFLVGVEHGELSEKLDESAFAE